MGWGSTWGNALSFLKVFDCGFGSAVHIICYWGNWGIWENCQICNILKSHPVDEHVLNCIQNVAFGYWGDCEIYDLVSVTSGVLKSHLPGVHVHNSIQKQNFWLRMSLWS